MWGNGYYGNYPMMGGYGDYGVFHIIGGIFWVIVVIAVVVLAVRALRGKPLWHCHGRHGGNGALEILRERYARGEIDREEFQGRKRDLGL